ncbi:exodeoxyribonuclease III [Candidatus Saccharibacteria bacterium]|nr:MAG: exodeoxyribonuclease III [Candidatus Saccharibacteria bacterium]
MKLYSWNVNGIRAVVRKGELQAFLAAHQPDILCLQETKAEQGQASFDAPDYHEYWNASRTRKGYSGTAIFSKLTPLAVNNDIPHDIADRHGLIADDYGHSNDEGRVIAAEFDDFFVVTAYTPNAKEDLSRLPLRQNWDQAMIAYCSQLQRKKPVLYCGDMNVAHTPDDLANPKSNRGKKGFTDEERSGFDDWLAAGFVDVFRRDVAGNGHYTWWSHFAKSRERNVGWRIDYWLASTDIADRVHNPQIHAAQMGSDHCPVSVEIDRPPIRH